MNFDRRISGFPSGLAGRMRVPALALAAALALCAAAPAEPEQSRNHFDTDTLMRVPGFFDLVVIGEPTKTRWLILTDSNPPSSANRLAQTVKTLPAGAIAAAIRRNVELQDGAASTFVRQGPSHAGMVLRMKDDKTFLLVLVDTATGDVVLTSHRDGKAAELGRGQAGFAQTWQKLAVKLAGPEVAVSFGDKALFVGRDPSPVPGRAGLATSGPGEASFDEFVLDY